MLGYLVIGRSSEFQRESTIPVNEVDLQYISRLVTEKDGGPAWIQMMDRSTPTMSYQAWRRDLEVAIGSRFYSLVVVV